MPCAMQQDTTNLYNLPKRPAIKHHENTILSPYKKSFYHLMKTRFYYMKYTMHHLEATIRPP